jgi:hypothetical protein
VSVLFRTVFFVVLLASSVAGAESQLPLIEECSAVALPGTNFMMPSGAGERLDGADGSGDMTIRVEMVCPSGPCILLPFQDIYIEGPAESNLAFCSLGNASSAYTNGQGLTAFTTALRGGGWAEGGVQVFFAGYSLPGSPLEDFRINSPDISGDLVVDLVDVGTFAQDFSSGYHFRSDFVADGVLNLADVGRLAVALGDNCN